MLSMSPPGLSRIISGSAQPLSALTPFLEPALGGPMVTDKTGLTDRYDLKLQWTPDDAPATDNAAPSLFTAIQEQLGLKLEPAKEPVSVLVIDHIEPPTPN